MMQQWYLQYLQSSEQSNQQEIIRGSYLTAKVELKDGVREGTWNEVSLPNPLLTILQPEVIL